MFPLAIAIVHTVRLVPPSRHLVNVAAKNRDSYANAVPFPHIALDGLFPPATPKRMLLVVHSHHGLEEVNQSAAVLRRSRGNWIVTQFDLLVLESHQGVPLHLVRAAAAAFPCISFLHLPNTHLHGSFLLLLCLLGGSVVCSNVARVAICCGSWHCVCWRESTG